ncbi:MAG: hypothetical protein HQK49_05765 [Oligoflexia bacterium]|nr:hypothetical protein [Oligoflexia bacterium]
MIGDSYEWNLPKEVRDSLVVREEHNGKMETFIRWPINPEDTKFHVQIKNLLKENGYPSQEYNFFNGYLTASRSIIVENPDNGAVFSIKVSTNKTGGDWQDKDLNEGEFLDSKFAQRLQDRIVKSDAYELQHLKILPEPVGYMIKDKKSKIEQGFVVRTLGELATGEKYYLPAFSVFHQDLGVKLAKMNGSNSPEVFWKDNLIKSLAKATAEFAAHTGMFLTSSHSQQYLVELDKNFKPTGKIVFRDIGDSKGFAPFYENPIEKFDKKHYNHLMYDESDEGVCVTDYIEANYAPLRSMAIPQWIPGKFNEVMASRFLKHFEREFSKITHIKLKELQNNSKIDIDSDLTEYTSIVYNRQDTKGWKRFFELRDCFKGHAIRQIDKKSCKDLLEKFYQEEFTLDLNNERKKYQSIGHKRKRDETINQTRNETRNENRNETNATEMPLKRMKM